MTVAAAIARILQEEGTEYLFCFPVSPLIDACAAIGIRPIVARTERTLVNMADGYSRATNGRRLGVVTVQHGPGAENAYAGVAQAFADGSPLLFLPGGNPRGRDDLPPSFRAGEAYAGVAKWSTTLAVPERVPERLRRAFTLLRTGRRAPVVLELPADVAAAEIEPSVYRTAPAVRAAGDPAAVREAVRLLRTAERPVLHVGQGVLWAEAWGELRALAEAIPAPVMTTLMGKSAFPEDHPLSLGTGGHSGAGPAGDFLRRADLIAGIGCSFTASLFAAPIPPGKQILHITNHEGDLSKDLAADCAVLGDARLVLQQMLAELGRGDGAERTNALAAEVRAAREAWRATWRPKLASAEMPINPYRVIHELLQVADRERLIITHDSGTPRDQLAPFWESRIPRGYLGWGKSTQLGSSLGFALGAKLACPEKWVVQFLGMSEAGGGVRHVRDGPGDGGAGADPDPHASGEQRPDGRLREEYPDRDREVSQPLSLGRLSQGRRGAGRGHRAGDRSGRDPAGAGARPRRHRSRRRPRLSGRSPGPDRVHHARGDGAVAAVVNRLLTGGSRNAPPRYHTDS